MTEQALGNGTLTAHAQLPRLSWALRSEAGTVRDHNEDYAGAHVGATTDDAGVRPPVFVVADGMGGHAAGEIASRVAVDRVLDLWTRGAPLSGAAGVRTAVRAANLAVIDAADAPERRGMGTTLTVLTLAGREATLAHIGDSRAYLIRDATCTQMTTDHSRAGDLLRMKLINAEQAARHPARSQLTRSLGHDPLVQVDLYKAAVRKDDVWVLCCDGVWDVVARDDFVEITSAISVDDPAAPTVADAASRLVELALQRGSSDNVTALVIQVTSAEPVTPETRRSLFRRRT